MVRGFAEYKIRWKGHGPEADSWEPEGNMNCVAMLETFWDKKQLDGPWSKIAEKTASSSENDCVEIEHVDSTFAAQHGATDAATDAANTFATQVHALWGQNIGMLDGGEHVTHRWHLGTCYYAVETLPQSLVSAFEVIFNTPRKFDHTFLDGVNMSTDRFLSVLPDGELRTVKDALEQLLCQGDNTRNMFPRLPMVLLGEVMRTKCGGNTMEALKRVQAEHRDTNQQTFGEVGEVHTVFCVVDVPRVIMVTELGTGVRRLLLMAPARAHAIHGRWVHAGWSLPQAFDDQRHEVVIFYVAVDAVVASKWHGSHIEDRCMSIDRARGILHANTVEPNGAHLPSSLAWPTAEVGECDGCVRWRPLYGCKSTTKHQDLCFECSEHWCERLRSGIESDREGPSKKKRQRRFNHS